MLCVSTYKNGTQCRNKCKFGDVCGLHRECPICYDARRLINLHCGHTICGSCETKWFSQNSTCPMCRSVVKFTEAPPQAEEEPSFDISSIAILMMYIDIRRLFRMG